MGKQKCSLEGCHAPYSLCKVTATPNYQQCKHFNASKLSNDESRQKKEDSNSIPWNGLALQPNQIELLSHRSVPQMIGLIGSSGAGKTTYLAMLYTLLFNGKQVKGWNFAGSYTLAEWELQAKSLQITDEGNAIYPDATSSAPDFYSIYHLALRNEGYLHDVLFADSSGEVFSKWAVNVNDPGAENARWIYQRASGFFFYINCEAIIHERGKAKKNIILLAEQVKTNLDDRPIILLWSKADLAEQMRPNIKKAIEDSLSKLFPRAPFLKISNYSKSDSDVLCHTNNLKAVEVILDHLSTPKHVKIVPQSESTTDFFFQYKGSYGSK